MAVTYYASSHLKVIDEKYFTKAVTNDIINKGIKLDFQGKNAVTIYSRNTVAENDYIRAGSNRFGELVEIGNQTQTFVLSQDKAWTFSVDRGNYDDSMMAIEVAGQIKAQVREVAVPTTDKYRLATLQAYAVANSQVATAALSITNIYEKFLDQTAALVEAEVTDANLHAYMSQATFNLLRRCEEVKGTVSDAAYGDIKSGKVFDIDGVKIHVVPSNYLPANTGFLVVADNVLVAPTKFDMIRTLDEVQGIDGWVAEGRRYYDAFVPKNKGKAIRAHMTA
ncbi:hypothetical protein GS464_29605 [Rhodococcus hoagii]|nr:hypothetical protein [Prescottella equi]MBM4644787.1 hypothetical protein [Prescottella equi]MBM4646574.1 hypothetical protein [Prescottella equi]